MANLKLCRAWRQASGIEIDEVIFDGERRAFVLYLGDKHIDTIYAETVEQTENMRASLDAGEDVREW